MLPRFEVVKRLRPVAVVGVPTVSEEYDAAGAPEAPAAAEAATPHPAPYAAVETDLASVPGSAGRLTLRLAGHDDTALEVHLDTTSGGGSVSLSVTVAGRTGVHRSRRHGRVGSPPTRLGLALTGTHLAALTEEDGTWVVRGRVALDEIDTRDLTWLDRLRSGWSWSSTDGSPSPVTAWRAGGFGQLGLRDLRVVTTADGAPYRRVGADGDVLLTATSAGPGFFDTAHTSVWTLESRSLTLRHLSDLFFERSDRPGGYGDHATHLVRDGDRWLVATSTWGDFPTSRSRGDLFRTSGTGKGASVAVTLAETSADLLQGRHRLPTRPLELPTDGFRSVGVWDPHLVHTGEEWLVGYVSARKFFSFHPVLSAGPTLDRLGLRAAATDRSATEGTTLLRVGGQWHVLASDGRDGPRDRRERFPVLDTDLRELGELAASYPTNIPWPTLVPPEADRADTDGWLLVTFNGTRYGGPLPGYGTHGEVVIMRGR